MSSNVLYCLSLNCPIAVFVYAYNLKEMFPLYKQQCETQTVTLPVYNILLAHARFLANDEAILGGSLS